jgi:DNA-binding transcriptional MerR regulator
MSRSTTATTTAPEKTATRKATIVGAVSRGESLRIGDVARLVGTTPRTIRYYEEIGLLPEAPTRPAGQHRLYTQVEVERLSEVMRLKHLLGVSLEELKTLLTAEEARAEVRAQLQRGDVDASRRQELLHVALGHIERQLELVRNRAVELTKLEQELTDTRKRVMRRIREQGADTRSTNLG